MILIQSFVDIISITKIEEVSGLVVSASHVDSLKEVEAVTGFAMGAGNVYIIYYPATSGFIASADTEVGVEACAVSGMSGAVSHLEDVASQAISGFVMGADYV